MKTESQAIPRKPAPFSAGIVGLDLTQNEEKVGLVLNLKSEEIQLVPKDIAEERNPFKDNIVRDKKGNAIITTLPEGEFVTVRFIQPTGFGTMFGKGEPEDEGNPVWTALRESLEESGMLLDKRIYPNISYREKPKPWGPYFNIVFLANCVGMKFEKALMHDPLVSKEHSGFYPLRALPYKNEKMRRVPLAQSGTYQAAIRRIVAIILQLDRPLLAELGRPDSDNAHDLVRIILARVRYTSLFSSRMLKTLVELHHEEFILDRLNRDKGTFHEDNQDLARHVGQSIVLWLPKTCLNDALEAFLARCNPNIRGKMEIFLGQRLLRRKDTLAVYEDKQVASAERDDKAVVGIEDTFEAPDDHYSRTDFGKTWLDSAEREEVWQKKRVADPKNPARKETRP